MDKTKVHDEAFYQVLDKRVCAEEYSYADMDADTSARVCHYMGVTMKPVLCRTVTVKRTGSTTLMGMETLDWPTTRMRTRTRTLSRTRTYVAKTWMRTETSMRFRMGVEAGT